MSRPGSPARAIIAAEREVAVATAQLEIIKALAPIPRERREQLMRLLAAAVENDCLMFVAGPKP